MKEEHLFTEKQIMASAFFGGPIPPGILIYKNLMRLDKDKEAFVSLAVTLVFTVSLIYMLISLPEAFFNKIPSQIFPSIIGLLMFGLYSIVAKRATNKELNNGRLAESNFKVAGLTVVGIIIYFGISLLAGYSQPPYPGDKLTFQENEIYFDKNTSENDVIILSKKLFEFGYFSESTANVAHLETWKTRYLITLPIDKSVWNDAEVIAQLQSLKWLLEVELKKEVSVRLEHYEITGQQKTKTL